MDNTAAEILAQLKKNEVYLQQMATTQEQILEVSKKRLWTEQFRTIAQALKFVVIAILIWISIVQMQKLVGNLTGSLGGLTGGSNLEITGANDLSLQLQNSQELMRELLGQ